MRDSLTFLAGLLVLVLTALLAVPPFVDWTAYRPAIDGALSRAIGLEVHSAGVLEIRLLPTPRLRMDRVRLGHDAPDGLQLDAMFVKAEVALTPLLSGEIRFLTPRIGRAEVKLPTGAGGDWRLSRAVLEDAMGRKAVVFDDLAIRQFLLTTSDPATGRTDQVYAEDVRVNAGSLTGPARFDGQIGGERFELALGKIAPDLTTGLKFGLGGNGRPRFDFDGKLALVEGPAESLVPRATGQGKFARLTARPAEPRAPATAAPETPPLVPVVAQAAIDLVGRRVGIENLAIEIGEGAGAIRLAGQGAYDLAEARLALDLRGRRVDAGALLGWLATAPGEARLDALRPPRGLALALDLRLDALASGFGEDATNVTARLDVTSDRIQVVSGGLDLPGQSRLDVAGIVPLDGGLDGQARLALASQDPERLLRAYEALDLLPGLRLVGAQPLQAVADVTLAPPVLAIRSFRLDQGAARLSGAIRYAAAEDGRRARLDAQLAAQGLDLGPLATGGLALDAARRLDFSIGLDARGLRYGSSTGGRVAGRIQTEGAGLVVEGLDLSGIAGAEAQLSGRISEDGAGRIEGRLKAARAAPLLDLLGRAWIGGVSRLVPQVLRDGPLDAAIVLDRAPRGTSGEAALRSRLTGQLAGGPIDVAAVTGERLIGLEARLSADRTGRWFGSEDPALRAPGRIDLVARRAGDGALEARLGAEMAGLTIQTARPLRLVGEDDVVESGQAMMRSADLRPYLALAGLGSGGPDRLPAAIRIDLARGTDRPYAIAGQLGDQEVSAELALSEGGDLSGTARAQRLSLPWLASALSLRLPPAAAGPSVWPIARFGPQPRLPFGGSVRISAGELDLGLSVPGRNAILTLATDADGFSLKSVGFELGGGRVSGEAAISRQGGLAALTAETVFSDLPLALFAGPPVAGGRVSGRLRLGASGESVSGLVGNLGGAGAISLAALSVDGANPAAAERAASRSLLGDDPLAGPRLRQLLQEELATGPFRPGPGGGNVAVVSGILRVSPLKLESEAGSWSGSLAVDLRNLAIDAKGALSSAASPRRWTGAPPYVTFGLEGPLRQAARSLDPGPLVNGLANAVLQRELERIETFELDAAERVRINNRLGMERARKQAAEEAARKAAEEEAARKAAEEAARRAAEDAARRALEVPAAPEPKPN